MQDRFWSTITAIKFKHLYYDKYRDISHVGREEAASTEV